MSGKTVLVTGGSSGIGRATAVGLAAMGAHLAITGRNTHRTEQTAHEIRAAAGGQVDVFIADLSSRAEVRRLTHELLLRLPRIDVLINNVGGYWNTRHVTTDGLERTFAVNHLASFLLTLLLLDRLTGSARPVTVRLGNPAATVGRIESVPIGEAVVQRYGVRAHLAPTEGGDVGSLFAPAPAAAAPTARRPRR